jgi:hypothetical protein
LGLIDKALPPTTSTSMLQAMDLVESFVLGQLGDGKEHFLMEFKSLMQALLNKVFKY